MNQSKICPNCKNNLEKGFLGTENESWISEKSVMAKLNWIEQPPTFGKPRLYAYRCADCGKVELYSEVQK
jgi:hypothetical protein